MSKEILIGSDMSNAVRLNGHPIQVSYPLRTVISDMSELGRVTGAKDLVEKPLPSQSIVSK